MRRLLPLLVLAACATTPTAPEETPPPPSPKPLPEETHFAQLKQLTFGGENAEAYWSFDGTKLSLQRHTEQMGCDRIFSMQVFPETKVPVQVSDGKGATTCSHFFPGGNEILFASTELGGDACPPKPDMSLGYVWALYDTYDIYKANADGSNARRLTTEKGYDAEATVCAKDGSIVFTSTRDGDIELYRMDADGKNVKRLTFEPGYDGGAFFNRDCTKIVWRASRPKPGKELDDFKALLAKGLVRPTKLELYVANADGTDAHQVTYLDSASFAPFWFPGQERIIFASNYGDPKGREFDLWAVNADGTGLERITYAKGFDGFPMFTPDGRWLAFASNRATPEGQHDTNLFVARWSDLPVKPEPPGGPERVKADVTFLADPKLEGRGVGTKGLELAGEYLERRFKELGLEPAGKDGYRDPFEVVTEVKAKPETHLNFGKTKLSATDVQPLPWSGQGKAKGKLVLAGFGVVEPELKLDDYAGLDVKGKVVVVRRFAPEHEKLQSPEAQRRAGDLRKKAFTARSKGAVAMLVVDWPVPPKEAKDWQLPKEAAFPALAPEGFGDSGLPVLMVHRDALKDVMPKLEAKQPVDAELAVGLEFTTTPAFNLVGRLKAANPVGGPVVLGAHYDHLGLGGPNSLAPEKRAPHLGADDNASGVAGVLEAVKLLEQHPEALHRDVLVLAFSGEENGDLGSSHFVRERADSFKGAVAMLNLDMVGRMRENKLSVLGAESADGWAPVVEGACAAAQVECNASGDGYGPSDHTPFYASGLPVLHFFTGAHYDYHKPSDSADHINDAGLARTALVVSKVAEALAAEQPVALAYKKSAAPQGRGDARSFNASLGTVPDYGGPPHGQPGVLLADVRVGGGAEKGGMRRGDILIRLGKNEIRSVEDLMYVLMASKPGETSTATVLRDGKEVQLEVTYQEGRRR